MWDCLTICWSQFITGPVKQAHTAVNVSSLLAGFWFLILIWGFCSNRPNANDCLSAAGKLASGSTQSLTGCSEGYAQTRSHFQMHRSSGERSTATVMDKALSHKSDLRTSCFAKT